MVMKYPLLLSTFLAVFLVICPHADAVNEVVVHIAGSPETVRGYPENKEKISVVVPDGGVISSAKYHSGVVVLGASNKSVAKVSRVIESNQIVFYGLSESQPNTLAVFPNLMQRECVGDNTPCYTALCHFI